MSANGVPPQGEKETGMDVQKIAKLLADELGTDYGYPTELQHIAARIVAESQAQIGTTAVCGCIIDYYGTLSVSPHCQQHCDRPTAERTTR